MTKSLKELLTEVSEKGGSDLHLSVELPPQARIDGALISLSSEPLTAESIQALCYECLSQEQVMRLEAERSIDLSFGIEGQSRYRANIFWSMDTVAGAFRVISHIIPSPEELGLTERLMAISDKPRGLVLITGQTGSGKSTTLAALLNHINKTRAEHIITVEDPIEYIYAQKKSIVNQREVGRDTLSFTSALKYILRQDPDVVLIGEMRDQETIQSAITVAETGHLVFATLHTNTAVQTIDRIVDVFPPHQQSQIRTQLAFILEGVFCQQLLPKIGGGRVLALETLLPHSGIRNLIREGKTHQIPAQMEMGQENSGMYMMDQSLAKLAKEGIVDPSEALRRCVNVENFKMYMKDNDSYAVDMQMD
jgi:twitching motility protein PilT